MSDCVVSGEFWYSYTGRLIKRVSFRFMRVESSHLISYQNSLTRRWSEWWRAENISASFLRACAGQTCLIKARSHYEPHQNFISEKLASYMKRYLVEGGNKFGSKSRHGARYEIEPPRSRLQSLSADHHTFANSSIPHSEIELHSLITLVFFGVFLLYLILRSLNSFHNDNLMVEILIHVTRELSSQQLSDLFHTSQSRSRSSAQCSS